MDDRSQASAGPLFEPEDNVSAPLPTPAPEGSQASESAGQQMPKKSTKPKLQIVLPVLNEEGRIPAYPTPGKEDRPALGIYHESFHEAENGAPAVCDRFTQVVEELKKDGYHNPEIEIITETQLAGTKDLSKLYPPNEPTSTLGPTGAGKSTCNNCLLHLPNVAPESGGSLRGTSLPHEFVAASEGQCRKYKVVVSIYIGAEAKTLCRRNVKNILAYFHKWRIEGFNEDESEGSDWHSYYETGIAFFRALLADRPEFQSDDTARVWFEEQNPNDEDEIVEDLFGGIQAMMSKKGLTKSRVEFSAIDENELMAVFAEVSKPPKRTTQPHPWALVRKVTVHVQSDLLKAGVTLTDLPGVADTNAHVVSTTTEYLKKSGTILVFATGLRLVHSEVLHANLRECIRLGKMRNVHLVVTKIDDGNPFTANDKLELSPDDQRDLKEAEALLESLREEERGLKARKTAAKAAKDHELYEELCERTDQMPMLRAEAKVLIKQVTIQIRCNDDKNDLRNLLRKLSKSQHAPDLPVHFIGSKAYQARMEPTDPEDEVVRDVETTGIPGLRRMLYTIPAHGKLHILSRVIRTRLPNIFLGIKGVLTKSKLERKQEVEKVVVGVLSRSHAFVDGVVADIQNCFQARIMTVFDENKDEWADEARSLLDKWSLCAHMTFLAFCKKSGRWSIRDKVTKIRTHVRWHRQMHKIFANAVAEAFDLLYDDLEGIKLNASGSLTDVFMELETSLQECQAFQGTPGAQGFYDYIQGVRDRVVDDMNKLFEELNQGPDGMEKIQNRATEDDGNQCAESESFVAKAMEYTYAECEKINKNNYQSAQGMKRPKREPKTPTGAHAGRVDLIRKKFTRGVDGELADKNLALFPHVQYLCEKALEDCLKGYLIKRDVAQTKVVTGWGSKALMKVKGGYDDIIADFQRRFNTSSDVKVEENSEAQQKLLAAASEALATLRGPLEEHIAACEAYEKGGRV